MRKVYKIRKGLDIKLKGDVNPDDIRTHAAELYAVEPSRFRLMNPRLLVQEGDIVECGTPVIQNKLDERIILTSPVSGIVKRVVRGDKRKLLAVEIEPDKSERKVHFGEANPAMCERETIVSKLLKSGLWPLLRQRPYAIIANPDDTPRDIFISAFDSAPLAVSDHAFIKKNAAAFQTGIDVLKKLTAGRVHIGLHAEKTDELVYAAFKNTELHVFSGPHPAGNVGVQIHQIAPINKGETVWYLYPQDVVAIGKLFISGYREITRFVTVAGSEVKNTYMAEMPAESSLEWLLAGNIKEGDVRVISGNVLSGTNVGKQGFLGFYESMITVIPEGNYFDFFGWAAPGFNKHSASRTFPAFLTPKRKFRLDTNFHGSERAFVLSDQYDKVFPFDILPVYLLKAILAGDIEKMEKLGIYEVAEEDFALCEYVCTSKIESQQIVRDGIDLMIKEMS
ncbi:MAG: NADH:ubiquinone reductase (Na(+)-transporting) subunit A [Bacteroidetes bacterium GWF2_43_63]|nr:MAG: NADH:ubiquinone reductase (Na(+)-transporting) subunit A [Bacteroidetes bacterium GWE2_42_42]OFY54911.1 MAG: NADH:ubiquinone reductase (Na(+)-transporting) subunit A [Bacteroidetes bacterium GWF2_43_63]HCB63180.1 NADH:ubiquinone reductase (Na(+)-transporting) subunit A [Bacteroidales bacterium]HCY22215.1 NADH:ubiquinone reductase (Na(+)-transporting) subunit A [Bacteroidales bacterium]